MGVPSEHSEGHKIQKSEWPPTVHMDRCMVSPSFRARQPRKNKLWFTDVFNDPESDGEPYKLGFVLTPNGSNSFPQDSYLWELDGKSNRASRKIRAELNGGELPLKPEHNSKPSAKLPEPTKFCTIWSTPPPRIRRLDEHQNKHFLLLLRWKVKNNIISQFVEKYPFKMWGEKCIFFFISRRSYFRVCVRRNRERLPSNIGAAGSVWVCVLIAPLSTQLTSN